MPPSGDHDDRLKALADFLVEAEPILRRRLRRHRERRRTVVSTTDLYASLVGRAVELEARSGIDALDPDTAGENRTSRLWALVSVLAERVVADARRRVRRAKGDLRRATPRPETAPEPPDRAERRRRVEELLADLDPVDRDLAFLRLRGARWEVVAADLGLSEEACRQRWARLMARLRPLFGG